VGEGVGGSSAVGVEVEMALYIFRLFVRGFGIIGLAVILPFAANNPVVIDNEWLIWLLGAIVSMNIFFNDPIAPT
jgi:hypothetical protein